MLRIVAIGLLLALVLPFGTKLLLLSDYMLRYKHYATVLCENKDNVEIKCNGKCQLSKNLNQIKEVSDENPLPETPSQAQVELGAFVFPNPVYLNLAPLYVATKNNIIAAENHYCYQYMNAVFHPPAFTC